MSKMVVFFIFVIQIQAAPTSVAAAAISLWTKHVIYLIFQSSFWNNSVHFFPLWFFFSFIGYRIRLWITRRKRRRGRWWKRWRWKFDDWLVFLIYAFFWRRLCLLLFFFHQHHLPLGSVPSPSPPLTFSFVPPSSLFFYNSSTTTFLFFFLSSRGWPFDYRLSTLSICIKISVTYVTHDHHHCEEEPIPFLSFFYFLFFYDTTLVPLQKKKIKKDTGKKVVKK